MRLDVVGGLTKISLIRFHTLSRSEFFHQVATENHEVVVYSWQKRPIHPHEITSHDTDTDLIPQARPFELVTIVLRCGWTERSKVGAIDGNEAIISNVAAEAILPKNLFAMKPEER
jgi:hypothetical protein